MNEFIIVIEVGDESPFSSSLFVGDAFLLAYDLFFSWILGDILFYLRPNGLTPSLVLLLGEDCSKNWMG